MALTVSTNLSSMIVQRNLNAATNSLDKAIERMSTGYRINHAGDNAAGFSIATDWKTKLGSIDVASQNAAMGLDMLTTAEENYALLTSHIQRVRDLTEQAANGTYGSVSLVAIRAEIQARLDEVDRIASGTEYNGVSLMSGSGTELKLQVGITSDSNISQITLDADMFKGASSITLIKKSDGSAASDNKEIAKECTGVSIDNAGVTTYTAANNKATAMLAKIDAALTEISARVTKLGSAQNKVESAISSLDTQSQNITSSLSTLRDTDVASESSAYIQAQILQQASATLLSTANQLPSVALNLI